MRERNEETCAKQGGNEGGIPLQSNQGQLSKTRTSTSPPTQQGNFVSHTQQLHCTQDNHN